METQLRNFRDIEVIAANLKRRHTGVTSTIVALLPIQVQRLKIAALGPRLPADWPRTTWRGLLRHGWQCPPDRPFRIWHARRNNEMLAGWLLRSLLRMRLKLVFTSDAQRHHTSWTRFLISRMDAVIAGSPEAATYLRVPNEVVLHGVDMHRYRPAEDREKEWAATGLPGGHGIGVFGRVRSQKGTDRFVEAMCQLLPRYPDFTAVVVGKVTPDQRGFADALKVRAETAGLKDRVVFLGECPADDVPLWLRRVTIVVGPQRWEGFGLVPIEAMASGAAVVATRVGAARHLIVEGETGYVVAPDDMAAMAGRIESLMKDPEATAAMGRRGRAHVVEKFSIEREASGIEAVYQRLWDGAAQ
ncbi:MAG TPA: glycosyltransferase family 4 protein [Verrucomicrobiae bacterium]|jgi:mannosyltransferase